MGSQAVIDATLLHPMRLTICAYLSGCAEAEFAVVRDYCGLGSPSMSKHAADLERRGYIWVRKGYVGKRPRTWLALTPRGRHALDQHLAAVQEIAAKASSASRSSGPQSIT